MVGWAGVARLGGVGDNLISSAVLRPLKKLGYKNEMITSDHAQSVFLNNPFIDKLTVIPDGTIPGDKWQEWFVNRSKEYDLFAHMSHTCEVRHALQVSQTSFWWPQAYRRKLCAGSYLETACDIMGVPHDFGPLFFPTAEEEDRAARVRDEQIGGRYIAWVVSGSRIDKVYPYAAMAIARIIKELGYQVVMIGVGGQQFEHAKGIMQHVGRQNSVLNKPYIDEQGLHTAEGLHLALSPDGSDPGGHQHWSIRRSITQAFGADLVITPDTGIAWAVAMEPMPKIVLLSHASEENITKHWVNTTALHADPDIVPCWPCHRLHNDISTCMPNRDMGQAAACISDISVETILDNVKRALGRA